MDDFVALIKIVGIFIYLTMAIIFCVTWIGMHKNTIDGNSLKSMYPFVLFDERQFTEEGNYWRKRHLQLYVVCLSFSVIFWFLL